MPEAAATAIIASLTAAGVSATVATVVAYTSVAVATFVASNVVADLTAPNRPRTAAELRAAVRQPSPPKRRGYGRTVLSSTYVLYTTNGLDSVDVAALHDGRIDGVEQVWLHEDPVTLGAVSGVDGWVLEVSGLSTPTGQTQRYSSAIVAALGLTGRFPTVNVQWRLGLPTETAYADLVAMDLGWTADHRGDNVASLRLLCKSVAQTAYLDAYPFGLPRASVLARAQRVYDWRDEDHDIDDPDTWVWSENPALCIAHFRCFDPDGPRRPFATAVAPHLAAWTQAADDCDAAVALAAGGSEPRYRLGLTYELDAAQRGTLRAMLDVCDGRLIPQSDGGEILVVGVFRQGPLVAVSDLLATETVRYRPTEERANVIRGTYVAPARRWTEGPYLDWVDAAALADAGGVEQVRSVNFLAVSSHAQARRLVKRIAVREAAELRGSAAVAIAARAVVRGRWARLPLPDLGIDAIDVEILGDPVIDIEAGAVTFEWVAVGAEIDAWNAAAEEGSAPVDSAIEGGVSVAFEPPALQEIGIGPTDAAYGYRIGDVFPGLVGAARPPHGFRIRFASRSGGAEFNYDVPEASLTLNSAGRISGAAFLFGLAPGQLYDCSVTLLIGGVAVATSPAIPVRALDELPSPHALAPSFGAAHAGGVVTLTARVPFSGRPGVALSEGAGVEFLRASGASAAFADAVSVGTASGVRSTSPTTGFVTLNDSPGAGAWRYWCRAVNSAGGYFAGLESGPIDITATAAP